MKHADVLLALATTALCETELFSRVDASPSRTALAAALIGTGGAALGWRGRAPLVASWLTLALALGAVVLVPSSDLVTPQYVLFLPPYTIGAALSRRPAVLGVAVCLAALAIFNASTSATATSWAFGVGMLGGSFFIGRVVRSERLLVAELGIVAASIAATREESSRLVVEDVRSKIATDVNVLIAETIASMVVTGETALRLLAVDVARADAAMLAVEEMGREALSEMRRVLGALRRPPEESPIA